MLRLISLRSKPQVFPGTLDHLSLPNYSKKSRHTFQLHLVEGPKAGVTWSRGNWLQYQNKAPFHELPVAEKVVGYKGPEIGN